MMQDRKDQLTSNFASARQRFLAISHPAAYARLVKAGELENHLTRIGAEAADLYLTLEGQLKTKAAEIAEERERQAYLSQIPMIAREMVIEDVIEAIPQ